MTTHTDVNAEVQRCPMQEGYDPLSSASLAEPQKAIAQFWSDTPIFYSPKAGWWVVSRYNELVEVLKDTKRFSSSVSLGNPVLTPQSRMVAPEGDPTDLPTMVNGDPPDHRRIRKLANKAFSPRAVEAWTPMITNRVAELLDEVEPAGGCDLLADFAIPLPITVIAKMLGFPEEVSEHLHGWSNASIAVRAQHLDQEEVQQAWATIGHFTRFLDSLIAERHESPGNDLVSALIAAREGDEPALTDREIRSIVGQLIVAGNETTRYFIAYMALMIMNDDQLRNELLQDPSLMSAAIEEGLRHAGVAKGLLRITTEPVEIGGVQIPEGELVAVSWGAANRDPDIFDAPDDFDIHRENSRSHIAFGFGEHFCIGAHLARIESTIAVGELLRRFPNIRRADDGPLQWSPNLILRGLERLDVVWDA